MFTEAALVHRAMPSPHCPDCRAYTTVPRTQEFSLETTTEDEHTEHHLKCDPASIRNFTNHVANGMRLLGRDINVTPKLKEWLVAAGFVDVVEKRISVP